jgi:hypothetical protein
MILLPARLKDFFIICILQTKGLLYLNIVQVTNPSLPFGTLGNTLCFFGLLEHFVFLRFGILELRYLYYINFFCKKSNLVLFRFRFRFSEQSFCSGKGSFES